MYKRRIKIFLVIIAAGLLTVVARLGHLQILHGRQYRQEIQRLLCRTEWTTARRGWIFDRTGKHILAMDRPCFDFCLDYRLLTGEAEWMNRQCRLIARSEGLSREQAAEVYQQRLENTRRLAAGLAAEAGVDLRLTVQRILRRVETIRQRVGMPVAEEEEAHPIVTGLDESVPLDGTVGAELRRSRKRWYPYRDLACHVIGLTGEVSAEEQRRLNPADETTDWWARQSASYLYGDTIGKRGVEKLCEEVLHGRRGYRRVMRNSAETVEQVPAAPGRDVHLTLDIELQEELTELLRSTGHNGCIAVLSVPRGEVLALVSVPVFDLNRHRKDYGKLVGDKANLPLIHRAVARLYPPGSTIKPVVASGGLAMDAITEQTTFDCPGYADPASPEKFRCWKRTGHGPLALTEALKRSCNVYFCRLGEKLGPRRMVAWFEQFGLGATCGTGLSSEVRGVIPNDPNHRFVRADAWLMGMGQGPIVLTPLHVANAMATIARDGEFRSPVLVLEGGPEQIRRTLPIQPGSVEAVKDGMHKVTCEPGGTAWDVFRNAGLNVEVCGKTGTAEELSGPGDMAWFAGFAPYRDPQIAFAVVVEYVEGGAARNAGPLAVELVRMCQQRGYVP